jgi:flagellar hook-basal body complex protein FliE
MMSGPINPVTRLVPGLIEQVGAKPTVALPKETAPSKEGSFTDMIGELINSVNDLHMDAGAAQDALLNGDPIELHEVMIKLEQAGVATDLLLEIRNRLLSGFNEVMRMPM